MLKTYPALQEYWFLVTYMKLTLGMLRRKSILLCSAFERHHPSSPQDWRTTFHIEMLTLLSLTFSLVLQSNSFSQISVLERISLWHKLGAIWIWSFSESRQVMMLATVQKEDMVLHTLLLATGGGQQIDWVGFRRHKRERDKLCDQCRQPSH